MTPLEKMHASFDDAFKALFGEVVTEDIYRVRSLPVAPDTVFDIGANVGIFTLLALSLWPECFVIAVEPDPHNCEEFCRHCQEFMDEGRATLITRPLGIGTVYHATTARNGSGEVYMSSGLGYPAEEIETSSFWERTSLRSISLPELKRHYSDSEFCLLKFDCEGAENCLWEDELSMKILSRMDYIAAELHYYAHSNQQLPIVRSVTDAALKKLEETHNIERESKGTHIWAMRK